MIKKTFKIEGMHCTSCALMIESDLEDAGVKARCSYAKQTLDVEFDEKKIIEKTIIDVVAKAGYHVV
jgi:copper chaperone CopZ